MGEILKKIIGNYYFRSITVLISGTVIAQLIPLLLQPILKRMFEPAVFGLLDIYIKIFNVLVVVFTLKLEYALVLPKNRKKVFDILLTALLVITFFFFVSEVGILFFNDNICILLKFSKEYSSVLFLLPISVFFYSIFLLVSYIYIRDRKFLNISKQKIIRRTGEGGINLISGICGYNMGLFIGDVIGNFIGCIYGTRHYYIEIYNSYKKFSLFRFKQILFRYRKILFFNLPSELLNTIALGSISFTVLAKFNIVEVGYLELTQKVLFVPSALIGIAIGKVILENIITAKQNNLSVKNKLLFSLVFLSGIAALFSLMILLFGESLFSFIFGQDWTRSGVYAKDIIPAIAFMFIISPFGQVLIGLGKLRTNSILQLVKFSVYLCLFFMEYSDIRQYLIAFSIGTVSIYLLYFFVISYCVFEYEKFVR